MSDAHGRCLDPAAWWQHYSQQQRALADAYAIKAGALEEKQPTLRLQDLYAEHARHDSSSAAATTNGGDNDGIIVVSPAAKKDWSAKRYKLQHKWHNKLHPFVRALFDAICSDIDAATRHKSFTANEFPSFERALYSNFMQLLEQQTIVLDLCCQYMGVAAMRQLDSFLSEEQCKSVRHAIQQLQLADNRLGGWRQETHVQSQKSKKSRSRRKQQRTAADGSSSDDDSDYSSDGGDVDADAEAEQSVARELQARAAANKVFTILDEEAARQQYTDRLIASLKSSAPVDKRKVDAQSKKAAAAAAIVDAASGKLKSPALTALQRAVSVATALKASRADGLQSPRTAAVDRTVSVNRALKSALANIGGSPKVAAVPASPSLSHASSLSGLQSPTPLSLPNTTAISSSSHATTTTTTTTTDVTTGKTTTTITTINLDAIRNLCHLMMNMPNLTHVDLTSNGITAQGFKLIVDALPRSAVRILNLSNKRNVMPHLQHTCNRMGNAGGSALAAYIASPSVACKRLKELYISGVGSVGFNHLVNSFTIMNQTLEVLDVSRNELKPQVISDLCNSLAVTGVKKLVLSHNEINSV